MLGKDNISIQLIPTKRPSIFKVQLQTESFARTIGILDKAFEGTYIKEVNLEKHKFNGRNSIGFCYKLLNEFNFRWIKIFLTDKRILETTRLFVLEHGKVLDFKKAGFEKQIFLDLNDFGYKRAKDWEENNHKQFELEMETRN